MSSEVTRALLNESDIDDDRAKLNKNEPIFTTDFAELKQYLSKEMWLPVYSCDCLCNAFSVFIQKLKHYIESSKTSKVKVGIQKIKPWVTNEICIKIKEKNRFYAKNKHRLNEPLIKQRYKELQINVRNLIARQKIIYYRDKFAENRFNARAQWRIVNGILGKDKHNHTLKSLKLGNGVTSSYVEISNGFNNFFKSVAEKSKPANCIQLSETNIQILLDRPNASYFYFGPIDESELVFVINNLKSKNSCGIDGISTVVIKKI